MNHKVEIRTMLKKRAVDTEVSVLATKREAIAYAERLQAFYAIAIKAKRFQVLYVGEADLPLGVIQSQAKAIDAARAERIASNANERVCAEGHIHASPEHAIACPNAPAPDVTGTPSRAKSPAPRVERHPAISGPRKEHVRPSEESSMGRQS